MNRLRNIFAKDNNRHCWEGHQSTWFFYNFTLCLTIVIHASHVTISLKNAWIYQRAGIQSKRKDACQTKWKSLMVVAAMWNNYAIDVIRASESTRHTRSQRKSMIHKRGKSKWKGNHCWNMFSIKNGVMVCIWNRKTIVNHVCVDSSRDRHTKRSQRGSMLQTLN